MTVQELDIEAGQLTGDQYAALLVQRATAETERVAAERADVGLPPLHPWMRVLPEMMIRDGDEQLIGPSELAAMIAAADDPQPVRPVRHITTDEIAERLGANRARLAGVQAKLDRLTVDRSPSDPAVVNLPLAKRAPTDAQLDQWRTLTTRRDALAHKVALDEARLAKRGAA